MHAGVCGCVAVERPTLTTGQLDESLGDSYGHGENAETMACPCCHPAWVHAPPCAVVPVGALRHCSGERGSASRASANVAQNVTWVPGQCTEWVTTMVSDGDPLASWYRVAAAAGPQDGSLPGGASDHPACGKSGSSHSGESPGIPRPKYTNNGDGSNCNISVCIVLDDTPALPPNGTCDTPYHEDIHS